MNIRRIRQVVSYGAKHASEIHRLDSNAPSRLRLFFDILYCFFCYKMWSNQYKTEKFYSLTKEDRQTIGNRYLEKGKERDLWQKDFMQNRRFLAKYSDVKYEVGGGRRDKRNKVYTKRYNADKGLLVENDVNISRQHYLSGTISIGENVILAKHVFIDYSGTVTIKDNVQLTNGVVIETHTHAFHSDYRQPRSIITPNELIIEEGAVVGTRAIILSTCHYIGRHARIGAGAVVTHDIPDYAVAVGVPARVIRIAEHN